MIEKDKEEIDMGNLEHHVRVWEKKKSMAFKRMIGAGIILAGLVSGIMIRFHDSWSSIPLAQCSIIAIIIIIILFSSLSSWSNYSFLYYYFYSQWVYQNRSEQIELVTGTIESMEFVRIPHAGSFKYVTIRTLDGLKEVFYVKPQLINGIDRTQPIRLYSHHMFVLDVNPVFSHSKQVG